MKSSDYQVAKLQETITVMRGACDRAERQLHKERVAPEVQIGRVLHELLWGLANANSGIQSALAECARQPKG